MGTIDGEFLSHLIFADDTDLLAQESMESAEMFISSNKASKPLQLKMLVGEKIKVILYSCAVKEPIFVRVNIIEAVDNYVYLRKTNT